MDLRFWHCVAISLSFLSLQRATAQSVSYIPVLKSIVEVQVTNQSAENSEYWLNETHYDCPAGSSRTFNLSELETMSPAPGIVRMVSFNKDVSSRVRTAQKTFKVPKEGHSQWELRASQDYWVFNLSTQESQWTLNGQEKESLKAFAASTVQNAPLLKAVVRTQFRSQVFSPTRGFAVPRSVGLTDLDPRSTYFVVGNRLQNKSYLLPLQDPQQIAEARAEIQAGSHRLVFAKIRKVFGFRGNQDLYHPTLAPWSWEIVEYLGLGDYGSQACDGSPQLIEERLPYYLKEQDIICFWDFHLLREL